MSRSIQGSNAHDRNDSDRAVGHDAQYLGTDGEGDDHYWSIYEQTVTVFDGDTGAVARVEHVGDRALSAWAAYVRSERGAWETLRLSDSPVADSLEVADR